MTKIKLCGLSRLCDVEAANQLRPEYIGFVFAPKSKRYVSPARAAELRAVADESIQTVGVFVKEDINNIVRLLKDGIIDCVQLHGDESDDYIEELRTHTSKPIVKAFNVANTFDASAIQNSVADFVLLDSGPGGTGRPFNWKSIKNVTRPFFLAGGLTVENAREAIDLLNPYAVDVSSGIETNGTKDKAKMELFVSTVRKDKQS